MTDVASQLPDDVWSLFGLAVLLLFGWLGQRHTLTKQTTEIVDRLSEEVAAMRDDLDELAVIVAGRPVRERRRASQPVQLDRRRRRAGGGGGGTRGS